VLLTAGHAGREAGRRLRAFEQANFFLEDRDRRVGVAAVDVARPPAQRYVDPLLEVVVAERRAGDERELGRALPEVSAKLSAPDREGVDGRVLVGHAGSALAGERNPNQSRRLEVWLETWRL
jgi:hypothetical protein